MPRVTLIPEVTIEQALDKVVKREAEIAQLIAGLNQELHELQPGIDWALDNATADKLKAKKTNLLEIKKLHEVERDELFEHRHQLNKINCAKKTLEIAQTTQDAINSATTAMRESIGTFNLAEVEEKRKDMGNLFTEIHNLSRALVGNNNHLMDYSGMSVYGHLMD